MAQARRITSKVGYMADFLFRLAERIAVYNTELTDYQKLALIWFVLKRPASFFGSRLMVESLKKGVAPVMNGNGKKNWDKKNHQQIFCHLFGVSHRLLIDFEDRYTYQDKLKMYEYAILTIKGEDVSNELHKKIKDLENEVLAIRITIENLLKLNDFFKKYCEYISDPMERMAIVYRDTFIPGVDIEDKHLNRVAHEMDLRQDGRQLSYEEIIQFIAGVTEDEYYRFESWSGQEKLKALARANKTVGEATKEVQDNLITRDFS